jgi:uncharacterized membrane protein
MGSIKRERIIFIDLMRALAVILMVQGHTIDTFLADDYRTYDSFFFNVWFTIRGFTAPIFMFSSGVAFTYLFRLNKLPFAQNPRVKKGVMRFVLLVLTGYLLRFPSHKVVEFSQVSNDQWLTFFTVDALHLIGFGVLLVLILAYIAEKYKLYDYIVFGIGAAFFFLMWNITEYVNWANYIPIPFAAWLYSGTLSLFPIFPWSGYVLVGAILGSYLANNPGVHATKKFGLGLMLTGIGFGVVALITIIIQAKVYGYKYFLTDNIFIVLMRLSGIILLNSVMSLIAIYLKRIPEIIKLVGQYTLLIYAIHIIVLYGSAWIPGFGMFWPKSLNLFGSILAAIAMIILMFLMVHIIEKTKPTWKRKFLSKKALAE